MADKKRNTYVDFLRGIAMLIVVLGHTMSGSTTGSQNTVLFNIVWSLQMPLFILISGYVTRYGKRPSDAHSLLSLLGKRTLAYLLPWFVFTILLNGVVLQRQELTLNAVFWHMDRGYWFLVTIWTISIVFILSCFAAEKLCRRSVAVPFVMLGFYLIGMAALFGLGSVMGMNFLCLKLTMYYMPFYFLGYLYGVYRDEIVKRFPRLLQAVVAFCTLAWIIAIVQLKLFELSDTYVTDIILRAGTSLCGCIAVAGLFRAVSQTSAVCRFIIWFGRHTIEVFLLHYYLLNLIVFTDIPDFFSARGFVVTAANYIITVFGVSLMILLLSCNRYLNLALFGKLLKKEK